MEFCLTLYFSRRILKLSSYSTENCVCVGHLTQMKLTQVHEMYMANARNLRLVPNAADIPLSRVGGFALGDAKNLRHLTQKIPTCWYLCIPNAKVPSFALGEAKVSNAIGFASQWNIGLSWQNASQYP